MATHCLVDSDHRKVPVLTVRKTGAAAGPIFTTHVSTGVLTTSGVVCAQAELALSPKCAGCTGGGGGGLTGMDAEAHICTGTA